MSKRLRLRGGRVIDPASGLDAPRDVIVEGGRIAAIVAPADGSAEGDEVVDVSGCWVTPGFIDLHVHLRDPGQEYKEDIETGARAGAAGGFTTICCMANTVPVNDNRSVTEYILERAREKAVIKVLPIGAVSVGLAGEKLADLADMQEAGCVAFSDDGHPVVDAALYRRALEYAAGLKMPVIGHCECPDLTGEGVMHEGPASTRAGLRGIPAASEHVSVRRDLELAQLAGAHYHVAHISAEGAVESVRNAKAAGLPVTAEVTPHHLVLTDEDVANSGYNTFFKMAPPLRSNRDREALIEALADGTIDCVATDHAPHSPLEKDVPFEHAANGVVGLETALPVLLELVRAGRLTEGRAIDALTAGAARCFGLDPAGSLEPGSPADLAIVDPDAEWTVTPESLHSRSQNSPFLGRTLRGRVRMTLVDGEVVWEAPAG